MDVAQLIKNMQLTRRNFLKLGLLAGAGLSLPSCARIRLGRPIAAYEPRAPRGPETWVSTVCTLCPGGCGLLVRIIEGKAIGVQGKPEHPVNQGTLCPRGFAALQTLYHPDRLRGPVRRIGKRSENRWEPISWEEAIQIVARRLKGLRRGGEPQRMALVMGSTTPLTALLFERFAQAFETPNLLRLEWPMGQGPRDAFTFMQGTSNWGYDLAQADFVLSFGFDWLQAFPSPVEASRAYGYLRRGRLDRRVRIVQVESRLSVTALKADTWVPLRPGTEGALALGLAHLLIAEGRYDRAFIEQHTFGFEDWIDKGGTRHTGFKTLVLNNYEPAKVAEITGVPEDTLIQLAREFAAHKPALALADRIRLYDQMAVHSLNALVGNLGVRGGVVQQRQPAPGLLPLPESKVTGPRRPALVRLDGAGTEAFPVAEQAPQNLPDVVLGGTPYTLDAVLLYRANPLFTSPDPSRWAQTLERVPFIVTISPFLDESALFADLILPEQAPLEGWQDAPTATLAGIPVFGIGQPVVEPLYDTQHAGDLLLELARALGSPLSDALPWQNFREALRESVRPLYASDSGSPLGPIEEETFWADEEEEEETDPFESFWKDVSTTGGWADQSLAERLPPLKFGTRSGKFEFYVRRLQEKSGANAAEDKTALPHYEPPPFAGDEGAFPLYLGVYTPLAFATGDGAHLPFLQGIAGPYVQEQWESWVEINPETGERLGIHDGDLVWVESPVGRIKAKARWFPGTMPEVVNLPFGLGHTALGRWAEGIGANPGAIVSRTLDAATGQPLWQFTRVKLYPVEEGVT